MDSLHDEFLVAHDDGGFGGVGEPGADFHFVGAEDGERIVVAAFYNCFKLGSVHHR